MEIPLFRRHNNLDGDVLGNFVSSRRTSHQSKPVQTVPGERPPLTPAWEKTDKFQSSEPVLDTKRMGEKIRSKSGLIFRGMMAGPIASSPQVGLVLLLLLWEQKSESWAELKGLCGLFQQEEGRTCVTGWEEHFFFSPALLSTPGGAMGSLHSFLPSVYLSCHQVVAMVLHSFAE